MMHARLYNQYSPLSVHSVSQPQNRAILLQFILSELFHAKDAHDKEDPMEFVFSSPACFFPYDWSYEVGCLNKIYEHSQLLEYAFPDLEEERLRFHHFLDSTLKEIAQYKKSGQDISTERLFLHIRGLYLHLKPFIYECKANENLYAFLLKNFEIIRKIVSSNDVTTLFEEMKTAQNQAIKEPVVVKKRCSCCHE